MPCEKCKNDLVFFQNEFICLFCNNIEYYTQNQSLTRVSAQLKKIGKNLFSILSKCDLKKINHTLLIKRAQVAEKIHNSPFIHEMEIKIWITLSDLIDYIKIIKRLITNTHEKFTYKKIIKKIIYLNFLRIKKRNLIQQIQQGNIVQLSGKSSNYQNPFFFTEKSNLSKIILENDEAIHFDRKIFASTSNDIISNLIISQYLQVQVKNVFGERILPFLTKSNSYAYFMILESIIGNASLADDISMTNERNELLIVSFENKKIISILAKNTQFSIPEIKIYLENLTRKSKLSIIFKTPKESTYFFCLHSLWILQKLIYSHIGRKLPGEQRNFRGKFMEDQLHGYLMQFNLKTLHPDTNAPLVGVNLTDPFGDIDVLGYSEEKIVIVESKFWESANLTEIDKHLEKFHKRILYIKSNFTSELSFIPSSSFSNIIPIFFCPLIPNKISPEMNFFSNSRDLLLFLEEKFGYLPKIESKSHHFLLELKKIFDVSQSFYAITEDMNKMIPKLPVNKFRILDGQVLEIAKNELNLRIIMPNGDHQVFVNITESDYNLLRDEKIKSNDFIQVIIENRQGNWISTNLVMWKKLPNDYNTYWRIFRYNKDKNSSYSLYKIFQKNLLHFPKFIEACSRYNENIPITLGKILGLNDYYDEIYQCECGKILAHSKGVPKISRCKHCGGLSELKDGTYIQFNYPYSDENAYRDKFSASEKKTKKRKRK